MTRRSQAGVTLIEMLVAITLLSLLSTGMFVAMRIGLNAFSRTDKKLMDNRRVAGAQRIVEQQIEGMLPVVTPCGSTPIRMGFFQGEPQTIRLVSTFSLQQAWRGRPQILEIFVIPGEDERGVRLVVNEIPYTGAKQAGDLCLNILPDPATGGTKPQFPPPVPGPASFVLADKLAYCRFVFLTPNPDPQNPETWRPTWTKPGWPLAVRIEMAPLDPDPSRLQPITSMVPIFIRRSPELTYADTIY